MSPETVAQQLAALGVKTFPVQVFPKGGKLEKSPRVPHWKEDASADPEVVLNMFMDAPGANAVGVLTGGNGVLVLDIDKHVGGADGYASLEAAGVAVPDSPVRHASVSGLGEHVFYAAPEGVQISPGPHPEYQGVDIKGGASFVVWTGAVPTSWSLPPAPSWMLRKRKQPAVPEGEECSPEAWIEAADGAPEGEVARVLADLPEHGSPLWSNPNLPSLARRIVDAAWLAPGGAVARERFIARYASGDWASEKYRGDARRAFDNVIRSSGIVGWMGRPIVDKAEPVINKIALEPSAPFKILTRSDLRNRPRPQWLIEGLLQGSGVVVFAGEGGIGKTYMALDWACHIATGERWQGRGVKRGRVLYVVGEGAEFFDDRLSAWEQHNVLDIPDDRLLYVDEGFSLSEEGAVEHMCKVVAEREVDLVVLDTLSQLSAVEDENANALLAAVLRRARAIRQARPGTSVLIVHHVSKGSGAVRGASAIRDNADVVIVAKGKSGGTFMISTALSDNGKSKNAEPCTLSGFYLKTCGAAAVVDRDRAADPVVDAIAAVLEDGAPHAVSDILKALDITSGDATGRKRVNRKLAALIEAGEVAAQGEGRAVKYSRATAEAAVAA